MITISTTITADVTTYVADGTTVGQVYDIMTPRGRLYVALAHDWDGDSEEFDPLVADTTDDVEQAVAEITKRYNGWLAYLRANGSPTPQEREAQAGPIDKEAVLSTRIDSLMNSGVAFDPQAAYDELNPKQRAAMRNVLAVEGDYRQGAVTPQGAYSRITTMEACKSRGLLGKQISGLPFAGSGFKYGYPLTDNGRAVAVLCEAKSVKLAHPADGGDPFAGMGTPDED